MPEHTNVAQRAAGQHPERSRLSRRQLLVAALAAVFAVGGLAAGAPVARAATVKVVVIVGPSGAATSNYLYWARIYAAQARSYGAAVTEVYTPNATWSRVRSVAQGANLLIYLGHGNGWPSPYAPFNSRSKDGLGLNPYAGSGNYRTQYWGEYYLTNYIRLAPNAVVLLNHLCYASGNSEPGRADPTLTVARQRVDNYGAGFLRTGARAVFAQGRGDLRSIIASLFRTNRTMAQAFWADPTRTSTYRTSFSSTRTPGKTAVMDPSRPGKYMRSVIGDLGMTAATWRP